MTRTMWLVLSVAAVAGLSAGLAGCTQPTPSSTPAPPVSTAAPPAVTTTPPANPPAVPPATAEGFEQFAAKAPQPVARVPRVATAPVVDGTCDDVYRQGPALTLRFLSGAAEKPKYTTTVRLVSTAEALYVFFDAAAEVDSLVANVKDADGPVYEDDCVEIFLDPTAGRKLDSNYHQILVNSIGTVADAKGAPDMAERSGAWNPKLTVKTLRGEKGWTAEVMVPFKELVADTAKIHRVWSANFTRAAKSATADEEQAWAPTESRSNHVPEKFGSLWLDAGTVDNAPPAP